MIVKSIPALKKCLNNSPFFNHPLVGRHIESITPVEVRAFIRAAKFDGFEREAIDLIKSMTNEAHKALTLGKLNTAPIIAHSFARKQTFTARELSEMLKKTTLVRRQAILFCLEADIHPRNAIGLTWKQVRSMHFSDVANDILDVQPRHIRLPYVFWEVLEGGSVAPLFALCETSECISGADWDNFRIMFTNMVWIDDGVECEELINDVVSAYAESI